MSRLTIKILVLFIAIIPFLSAVGIKGVYIFKPSPEDIKTFFGIVAIATATVVWFIDLYRNKVVEVRYDSLYIPIAGFIVWSCITLFWVIDQYSAYLKIAQFLSYALLYFLLVNSIRSLQDLNLFTRVIVGTLSIASIIGLLQSYNIVNMYFLQSAIPSITFGNKNMASHFLVIAFPLSITLLLLAKKRRYIFLYSIIIFLALWTILQIQARQAFLAISIEILFLFLFLFIDFLINKKSSIFNLLPFKINKLFSLFLVLSMLVFVTNNNNNNNTKFDRPLLKQVSENERIPTWLNSVEMIEDHFIKGVGVGQWFTYYHKYQDKAQQGSMFNEVRRVKRLHNDFLQVFSELGLVGFLFLLWMALIISRKVFLIFLEGENIFKVHTIGAILGLFGFLTVSMFSFPVEVYLPVILVVIHISTIAFSLGPLHAFKFPVRDGKPVLFVLFLASFSTICIYNYAGNWLWSRQHFALANNFNKIGDHNFALAEAKKALSYNSVDKNIDELIARSLLIKEEYSQSIPYYESSIKKLPFDTLVLLNTAKAYQYTGEIKMAEDILKRVLNIDFRNVRAYLRLTRIMSVDGKFNNANIFYKKMKLSFEYYKNRDGFGPYHSEIIDLSLHLGDYGYISYMYSDLLRSNPTAINYMKYGLNEYQNMENKVRARELFKKAIALNIKIPIPEKIKQDLGL